MNNADRARSVLITTSTLPIRDGDGVPRFVLDLAQALSDHYAVTILAPHAPGAPMAESRDAIRIRRFRYVLPASLERLTEGGVLALNLRGLNWLLVPFLLLAQTIATAREVIRMKPVAVNAHWLIPQGLTASMVCSLLRVPLVLHVHAGDVYRLASLPLGRSVARLVVRRSSRIFADGSHVRDTLDHLLGRPSHAVLRPMGVWTEQFEPDRRQRVVGDPRIVFVGRLVEKKGLRFLIEAMTYVRRSVPSARLRVVGSGPLEADLTELRNRLGLQETVEFLGPLSHADLVAELHEAAVACVPSVIDRNGETDGMPTVVIEAMAAGLPVVGSAVDGIPDVIRHGENGWLSNPGDPEDIAAKLIRALDGGREGPESIAGQLSAMSHDWGSIARVYFRAISEVAGD